MGLLTEQDQVVALRLHEDLDVRRSDVLKGPAFHAGFAAAPNEFLQDRADLAAGTVKQVGRRSRTPVMRAPKQRRPRSEDAGFVNDRKADRQGVKSLRPAEAQFQNRSAVIGAIQTD